MKKKISTYDELVILLQDKQITQLEFIQNQPVLNDYFTSWCNDNHIKVVDENTTNAFFTLIDEVIYNPIDYDFT